LQKDKSELLDQWGEAARGPFNEADVPKRRPIIQLQELRGLSVVLDAAELPVKEGGGEKGGRLPVRVGLGEGWGEHLETRRFVP
jgi:hypothetical protein